MPFEVTVEKLVYGGAALGYAGGKVVLVFDALPGERLEAEEVRRAKGVIHARPLRLIEPNVERIPAPCPYFGCCGGCQYQHLRPARQTLAKSEILRETLRRVGKIAWEREIPVHAAEPWNYRNQAQFKVSTRGASVELGFYEAESHRPVPIEACLILSPRLNAVLSELRRPPWPERLARLEGIREIELMADDRDERVIMVIRAGKSTMREQDSRAARAQAEEVLAALPAVQTVAVDRDGALERFGEPWLHYQVGEFRYRVSPGSFFQSSRFLLPQLVAAALNAAPGAQAAKYGTPDPEPHGLALDLFAGVGLFTLPLARRCAQVIGVEANRGSAADLKANATAHGASNVQAVSLPAFDFLRRFAQGEPDFVLLDPPRAGVGAPTLARLADRGPHRIHYVSCHPPTLARDLRELLGRGYGLESVEMFDLFPQTYHIESLARLVRRPS